MKLFYRFLVVFCVVLFSATVSVPFVSQADELAAKPDIEAVNDIKGTWNVVETYDCCGDYIAVWKFTIKSQTEKVIKYALTATRKTTSGDFVKTGTAKLRKKTNKVVVKHGCYGDGCGSCGYKFKGKATASQISGSADYCSGTTGTFVATKASSNTDEGIAPNVSDNGPNPN